jgi:undecaprenyl diphosphate synthase
MHVAIIMDGNGRWALQRGLPRTAGHLEGARAVHKTIEAAARSGIRTLTLYAFSSDNWRRPRPEVAALMKLFRQYLGSETQRCLEQSIRISVIGRRDRLDAGLCRAIEHSERVTAAGSGMHLRIAVDYSARHSILIAARLSAATSIDAHDFGSLLNLVNHSSADVEDVDLLIRTGGEQRLSDFLLWESAYAELYFCDRLWPDFSEADFQRALSEFTCRQRRFGGVTALPSPADFRIR